MIFISVKIAKIRKLTYRINKNIAYGLEARNRDAGRMRNDDTKLAPKNKHNI